MCSLNVALQRLQYTPDLYFGAADNVTIVVDDQDYRGPGRNGVAAATLLVNVTCVPPTAAPGVSACVQALQGPQI